MPIVFEIIDPSSISLSLVPIYRGYSVGIEGRWRHWGLKSNGELMLGKTVVFEIHVTGDKVKALNQGDKVGLSFTLLGEFIV